MFPNFNFNFTPPVITPGSPRFQNPQFPSPPTFEPGSPDGGTPTPPRTNPTPAPSSPPRQRSTPADIGSFTRVVLQTRGEEAAVSYFLNSTRGYTEEEARQFVQGLANPGFTPPSQIPSDFSFRDLPPLNTIPSIPSPLSFENFVPSQGNETTSDLDRFQLARRRFRPNGG